MNTELIKWIVTLERQCWVNGQYSRKEFVEVVVVPSQIDDKHLEVNVLSIFQKFGCTIPPEFIEDCHCLGKNSNQVILNSIIRRTANKYFNSRKT